MITIVRAWLRRLAALMGISIKRTLPTAAMLKRDFPDIDPWVHGIVERLDGMHMTSPERINAVCKAVEYLARNGIAGDFVECGVWRGGSAMAMAMTLVHLGRADRDLYLFDTFEGMTPPTEADRDLRGDTAADLLRQAGTNKGEQDWAYASLDDVKRNMEATRYKADRVHYVQGRVEDTLPAQAPATIALLRLDTDWYESTIHELRTLWSRLAIGGILIVDDYGHWQGSRQAVDEFFAAMAQPPLLARIDYSGRLAVKLQS